MNTKVKTNAVYTISMVVAIFMGYLVAVNALSFYPMAIHALKHG